jgi:hypothetical protein
VRRNDAKLTAVCIKTQGYLSRVTKVSGDFGVDIIAEKAGTKYPCNTGFSAFLAMIKLQYLHKCLMGSSQGARLEVYTLHSPLKAIQQR